MHNWTSTWTKTQRARTLVGLTLLLVVLIPLYLARRALPPFVLGTFFAYILLPVVNALNSLLPARFRNRGLWRSISVLAAYLLTIAATLIVLAFVIPPIAAQIESLAKRLPDLASKAYSVAPEIVQDWVILYNQLVPASIRQALQASIENTVTSLGNAVQAGIFKSIKVVFSTLSFMLGLLVIPFWTFYVLRDQPRINAGFHTFVPPAYREDIRNILTLVDNVLSAYLRGRLILGLCMATVCTIGLLIIGIDLALLLGTIAGISEIVPLLGPILGAVPVILVTVATAPEQLLWVILLLFVAEQIVNYLLVPQVARGTVGLHPALVILVIVVGSEVAGIWGVLLSVPLTAVIHRVAQYACARLADEPLSPQEALARVNARH